MKSNIRVPEEVQDAGRVANRTVHDAASSRWMTVLARLGYAAKGVVYLIIGWLAVQLVIGAGGKTTDQRGALQTIYDQPFGKFLLALVFIGLLGFAIWCFLQAWFDTEGTGSATKSTTASTQDVTAQPTGSERVRRCLTDAHTTAVWPCVPWDRCTRPACLWRLFFRGSSLSPCWRELILDLIKQHHVPLRSASALSASTLCLCGQAI